MRFDSIPPDVLDGYSKSLAARAQEVGDLKRVQYLDLGTHVIRLINYSSGFVPHIERNFCYVLRDEAEHYDATLVVWHEPDVFALAESMNKRFSHRGNLQLRVETISRRAKNPFVQVWDTQKCRHWPLLELNDHRHILTFWDSGSNTWYFAGGFTDLQRVIMWEGHLFASLINKMIRTPSTALAHAAVVGLDGLGILACGRGRRGKTTLAVRAMLDGFDYVSDDYLILEQEHGNLYAWPIYSHVSLSPAFHEQLKASLQPEFIALNCTGEKHVLKIANWHHAFSKRYPVQLGLFPERVADTEPSIRPCTMREKGQAIAQVAHSTVSQLFTPKDTKTVKKLIDFMKALPFYKINLCSDIDKNQRCLREFITGYNARK